MGFIFKNKHLQSSSHCYICVHVSLVFSCVTKVVSAYVKVEMYRNILTKRISLPLYLLLLSHASKSFSMFSFSNNTSNSSPLQHRDLQ